MTNGLEMYVEQEIQIRKPCVTRVFDTEVRISRLRLNTQANGEKSLRTRILLKLPHQFLKEKNFEKKTFENSIFPRFG